MQKTPISLEFFPTKSHDAALKMRAVRQQLQPLQAAFCSVTHGAGGSTQEGTLQTLQDLLDEGVDAASHFSCIGVTKTSVRAQLQQLKTMGVRRIVALRGDLPKGYNAQGEFQYASDLVAFIRAETGDYFNIVVAAYPETHPQAPSPSADLQAFVDKVRAGANAAITQYFFNPDTFLRFRDEVHAHGLTVPIIPGIMPITNVSQLLRFSDACGTEIPRWIRLRLQSMQSDQAALEAFGLDVVTQLCERLIASGVPALHFYTMNQSKPTLALCKRLGLGAAVSQAELTA